MSGERGGYYSSRRQRRRRSDSTRHRLVGGSSSGGEVDDDEGPAKVSGLSGAWTLFSFSFFLPHSSSFAVDRFAFLPPLHTLYLPSLPLLLSLNTSD
jgi:hypothetical protein